MLLLDTHALLWLVRGQFRTQAAVDAVAAAQDADTLYASAITAWELGTADLKRTNRPELDMAPGLWFPLALRRAAPRRRQAGDDHTRHSCGGRIRAGDLWPG